MGLTLNFFNLFTIDFSPWLGLLIGAIFGGILSVLHAYLSINLQADQTISGTAINLLAGGITIFFAQIIFNQQRTAALRRGFLKQTLPNLSKIPIIGPIFFTNIYAPVALTFILVLVTYYFVYKTSFGLRLRACGEHPSAADSMGVSVVKMRYYGVILSGLLAGLAGAIMVLTQGTQYTAGSIHGTGFIAIAALVFGKWRPLGVLGAGLFFGFSQILALYSNSIPLLSTLPSEFFNALPYVLTIVALVIFSSKDVGPKAAGVIYEKGAR
jgi:general nucleoside transport system permease protein